MENPIIQRLILVRKEFKLTQHALALVLGKGTTTIGRTEAGDPPTEKLLNEYQRAFYLNPEWLKTGKGEMFLNGEKPRLKLVLGTQNGAHISDEDFTQDSRYLRVKKEVESLREQVESLTATITILARKVNFHNASYLFPGVPSLGAQYGAHVLAEA